MRGIIIHYTRITNCIIFEATTFSKTEEFIKKCIIAKQFDHSNVLGLIGVSFIQRKALPLMILPYMHNGGVRSFVMSKKRSKDPLIFQW